ncbi:MAG: DJ-1/PfpI family protein [Roseibium sp.]|uniref:DJ-1/PfpI family protein n=1 Tax=Roseibium sp. TaxID=1936156 RepID=UPI0026287268|nr:DJ-1/PfpI family protein [Roseibium sp.]MCV0428392.1 DJ-1/PfpI family protein [Roseibium sp.]
MPPQQAKGPELLPITILVTEGFSDWEIATLAGLGRAFYNAEVQFVSPEGGPVTSAAGLRVADTVRFEATGKTVVAVCGGPMFEKSTPPSIEDRLRSTFDRGSVVAGICGGTTALARAGLLNAVRHTSNGPGYLENLVPEYSGSDHYVDVAFAIQDNNIITAPAPAPATFAVEVLAASGLDRNTANQITAFLAKEHAGSARGTIDG